MSEILSQQTWTHEGRPNLARKGYTAPPGPWYDEPDKVQWIDGDTDLDCLVVRGPGGDLCGYVGIPKGHWLHGRYYGECTAAVCDVDEDDWCYDHTPQAFLRVHGGLTFSSSCDEEAKEGHGICHVPLPGRDPDVWWFGFDTGHHGDLMPSFADMNLHINGVYRDLAYVQNECAQLAAQLVEVKA